MIANTLLSIGSMLAGMAIGLSNVSAAEGARLSWPPYADIAVKEMRQFPENNTAPGETCWGLEQGWFWQEGARPKTARQVPDLLTAANG